MISFKPKAASYQPLLIGVIAASIGGTSFAQVNASLPTPATLNASSFDNADAQLGQIISHLSLAQALEIALAHNRDVKLGQIAVDTAAAMKTAAGAAPNPMLTIQTAGINPKLGIGPGKLNEKTVDTTMRIDQLIERGGKRGLRLENAAFLEDAARLDASGTRKQTKLAVNFAYFDLIAAQHKLRVANDTRDLFKVTQTAAEQRKKSGDIAGADAARIHVDVLRAQNDARQAAADLLHAQTSLLAVLGLRVNPANIQAMDDWPDMNGAAIKNIAADLGVLIEKRPDVLAAKARYDAAIAARKLAVAAKTRDVSVGLQFEHYPVSVGNPQGSGNSFGVSVQIPLFARYEFQGEIRAAETAVDAANETLEKTREAAAGEIRGVLESALSSQELVQRFRNELLTAARHSAEAAEFAFKNGAIGVMDVLDARRTYRATELDAINAQTDFAKALAALRISTLEDDK